MVSSEGLESEPTTPRLPRGGVPPMQKLRPPWRGVQGYQMFPFYTPVVGQSIDLHVVPAYRASTYIVSAFPAHSTSFSTNLSNPQQRNVYWAVNPDFLLVVGIHFISPDMTLPG